MQSSYNNRGGTYNNNFDSNSNMSNMNSNDPDGSNMNQVERSLIPSRYDTCKILLSGTVGNEPKEIYLSNGHYVINFSLAVVGHYSAVHDWEKYKPTETMWVNAELWDDEGKKNMSKMRKGSQFFGVGSLIMNKWIDKVTGEEKKMFKARILKVLSSNDMSSLVETLGLDSVDSGNMYDQMNQEQLQHQQYDQSAPTTNKGNINNYNEEEMLGNNDRYRSSSSNSDNGGDQQAFDSARGRRSSSRGGSANRIPF